MTFPQGHSDSRHSEMQSGLMVLLATPVHFTNTQMGADEHSSPESLLVNSYHLKLLKCAHLY